MDMSKYYLNTSTGEITNSHEQAVEWYREGIEIEIYRDGKKVLTWEM